MLRSDPAVAEAIEGFSPRTVSGAAAAFAREVTAQAKPESPNQAKAYLFAASRLGAFCESIGLELTATVALHPSVVERLCHPETTAMSLDAPHGAHQPAGHRPGARVWAAAGVARARTGQGSLLESRDRLLPLLGRRPADRVAPHAGERPRVPLGGCGLMGADLKAVCGADVIARSGGVVVCVRAGRRPRVVPVLSNYHDRLLAAAHFAGDRLVIGGTSPELSATT